MSNRFEDVSRAFEQDERRPQLPQERADVFAVLQGAEEAQRPRQPLRRFVEPTGYQTQPEQP